MEEIENFATRLREVLDTKSDEKENDENDQTVDSEQQPLSSSSSSSPSSSSAAPAATATTQPPTVASTASSESKKRSFAGDDLSLSNTNNTAAEMLSNEACSLSVAGTSNDDEKYKPEVNLLYLKILSGWRRGKMRKSGRGREERGWK
ncbi:unnamed protein product [Gongylonema pulchrum]|uniref:Uncharacterized protein n=1 Tax=Gongylonema pulchrum TaxID=637853 RepID=A0A183EZU0_9BILA|nr:unnamed protein product [Gongylonema pulchrum]